MFTENANKIFNRVIEDYHCFDDVDHKFENPYPAEEVLASSFKIVDED